jgi:DNA topoisomerase II
MLMTDQDHDGSHIKGLIINFLHCYWPSLLQNHDFLREFVTPIVKVSKARQTIPFFTLTEYNEWKEAQGRAVSAWNIKYYKGLGTSTSNEAKEYFSDLQQHELTFSWAGDQDGALIERAFSKSMADARKEWLRKYDPLVHVDHSASHLTYSDFIDSELIHFSNADNVRSIPSVVDGLKPGQRKILFACFKRGKSMIKNEIKVAQLAGYVSEHSAYHHGEASLAGTIVGMAQTFVGSNNIPLLHPAGQFGTRLLGGKDAASPRYIFTRLPQLTRLIFHPDDDALLGQLEDDGQKIEPKHYVPILPMVLVNGAEGIGTGWSSSVPMYNPRDIVANLKLMMEGAEPAPMTPWYRGFSGAMQEEKEGSYVSYGTISKVAAPH